ncbi:MAG: SRPBCC family protein [Acidimicrobiia bacterium]|nr:SRPBCC family protein [Acidimicrobiia bacterium]
MASYVCVVQSNLSPEEAFAYMADLRNFEKWDPGVSRSVRNGDTDGLGASYDVTASGTELTYTIVEHEAPTRVVAEARTRLLRSYDVITVEPADDGCRVTYDASLELNGLLGLFDPFLRPVFNRIGDKAADGLESALDGTLVSRG